MYEKIKNKLSKSTALTISLALVFLAVIGGTVAYLIDTAGPVTNTFTPSNIDITVDENFEGKVKENVQIKNTGDTAAYIRAKIVVTWKKTVKVNGEDIEFVFSDTPELGTHYTMELNNSAWIKGSDGFYYYLSPVSPESSTSNLINKATWIKACDDTSYSLSIDIISQAIQADGVDSNGYYPVVLAWNSVTGIDSNGLLIVSTSN